jgi:hypothetical protein
MTYVKNRRNLKFDYKESPGFESDLPANFSISTVASSTIGKFSE